MRNDPRRLTTVRTGLHSVRLNQLPIRAAHDDASSAQALLIQGGFWLDGTTVAEM